MTADEKRAVENWEGDPAWPIEARLDFHPRRTRQAEEAAAGEVGEQELDDLRRRLRAVEAILGPDGETMVAIMAEAVAEATGEFIAGELDRRSVM